MISKLSAGVPALLLLTATPALAQGEQGPLDVNVGLMIWTVLIFVVVLAALAKFAWPNILGAVEKREQHIRDLIAQADRDRAEAAALADEQRRLVEETRARVHEALNESRSTAEHMRAEILEQARREHDELLARARADISAERATMEAAVRADAVDVAIAAAEKLVQRSLNGDDNRRLVQGYLAALDGQATAARAAGHAAAAGA
ncbi:F0F1 ATP synthase subunit B [Longimicrobium sp.]|uniref:F0F1 ATP synthase subunit B n=1 Tax=Longimicrobium sp. TaxID=2029185 RepID=UPI002C2F839F|nr:F0F1 ATP synthase subunit B [Longimicrobium sp.]HSU16469.1 F0F1 ATP synthase subunit B [Longimicrobium sp.]